MRTNPNPVKGNTAVLIPAFNGRTGLLLAHEIFEGYRSSNVFAVVDFSKYDEIQSAFVDGISIPIIVNFQIIKIFQLIEGIKVFKQGVCIVVMLLESDYIKYQKKLSSYENVIILIHRGYVNDRIKHELGLDMKRRGVR